MNSNGHTILEPQNDELSRNLRRYQVRLKVTASGVVIFAIWDFIRNGLMMVLRDSGEEAGEFREALKGMSMTESVIVVLLVVIMISFFFFIDLFLRLGIYKSAKRESMGLDEKQHNGYLVMTVILALLSIFSIFMIGYKIYTEGLVEEVLDDIASVVLEVTNFVTLIELIYSAVHLRELRRQYVTGRAESDDNKEAD